MKKNVKLCLIVMVIALLNMVILPNKVKAEDLTEASVAMIGESKYDTLQQAFDAVNSNQKETVVNVVRDFKMSTQDIATLYENKNVVLNMNGKTITVDSTFVGRPIVNKGTLKVIGNGIIDSSMSSSGSGAINNTGDLTIDNGTYSGNVKASGACVKNAGKLTINNGTFNKATCAIYNDLSGSVVINNGLFDTRSCSACNKNSWSYTVRSFGSLTFNNGTIYGVQGALAIAGGKAKINNGHFETLACSTHGDSTAFYALYVAGERGETETEVNGGKFISASKSAVLVGNDNDGGEKLPAKCNIKDGEFITKGTIQTPVITSAAKTGDPLISGGKFCKSIDLNFLSLDCKLFDNKDGTYTVAPIITSISFDKKAEAVELGKTISLQVNILPNKVKDLITWTSSNPSIASVDENGKVTTKSIGKVEITAEVDGLSATCSISVYKIDKPTLPPIDTSKPVEEVQVGVNDNKSQQVISNSVNSITDKIVKGESISNNVMSNETLKKFKEAIDKGENVKTIVDVKIIDKSMIDKKDIDKLEDLIQDSNTTNKEIAVAQYLDLSVNLSTSNEILGTINQLNDKVGFTVMIPESLQKENRIFYIVRIHDGKAEKLETKLNEDGTLTFMTDRFSTYALVYEDDKNPDIIPSIPKEDEPTSNIKNPVSTNDSSTINVYIIGIVVSMVISVYMLKKKSNN